MATTSTDRTKKKYARFTIKDLADSTCQAIASDKKEEWNGRATIYAVPIKKGRYWYVPVLPGYDHYFKGMKLYNIN